MRNKQHSWILLSVLTLGMVSFYLIVFHGTAFRKAYRSSAEWSRSVSKPARGFLNPSFYHPSAAPQKAPDAVTGATPRIIAFKNSSLAKSLRPSVVGIRSSSIGFARPGTRKQNAQFAPAKGESVGSGVIINRHGYIITNAHVVAQGNYILISIFSPGKVKEYTARIISFDRSRDLALLKIETKTPLVSIPIGNSDSVRTGDRVIAIGNPFGLNQTLTSGIVSARHRGIVIGNKNMKDLIQTDVPINPGNSGGALCSIDGYLIGINVAIYSPVESVFSGISFTIPINTVKELYGNYMDLDKRPSTLPVNYAWPTKTNQKTPQGFSPANPARIQPGDRIMPSPGEGIEELAWLGIDVTPSATGVEVDEIEGISPMEAGLQAGDIIKVVNGMPTPDIYAFKDALKNIPLETGQGIVLDIHRPRDNRNIFISFRLKKWDLKGR